MKAFSAYKVFLSRKYYLQVLQFLLLQELQPDEEEDRDWENISVPLENFAPKADSCLSTRSLWQ
jgi:hypothetical protein